MELNWDSADHGTSSHCHNNIYHRRVHGGFRDCSVCLELLYPNPVCDGDKNDDSLLSETMSLSTAMRTTNTTTTTSTTWMMGQQLQKKRKMTFIIPCGHVFHTDCYHMWNQTQYKQQNHRVLQCATCNGPVVASYYVLESDFNCIVCCQSIHASQQSVSFTLPDCQLVHTECWMQYQATYHNINHRNNKQNKNDGTTTTSLRHQSSSSATTRPSSQPIHRWRRSVFLKATSSSGRHHHHQNNNSNNRAKLTTTGSSTKQQYHQSVGVSFQGIPISNIYNVYLFHHNDDNIDSNKVQQEVHDGQKADGTTAVTTSSCCTTTTNYLSMILRDYTQLLAQQQPVVALSVKSTIVNRLLAMFAMDVNDRCVHNSTSIDTAAFVLPTTVEDIVHVLCTIRDCPIRQTTLTAMDGIHMVHAIAQVFEQLKEHERKCNGMIQNEGSSKDNNIQGTRQIDNDEPTSVSLAIQEQQYTTTTSLYDRCCLLLAIVCATRTLNCQTAITTGAYQSMLFGVSLSRHQKEEAGCTPTSTAATAIASSDAHHDNMSVGLRMSLATFIYLSLPQSSMPYSMMINTILETMQRDANNTHVQWAGLIFLTQYMQWAQCNRYDSHSRDEAGSRWCRRWLRRHRPPALSIQPCSNTPHQQTHDNCCALIRKQEGYFREIINLFPNDLAMTTAVESLLSTFGKSCK